jgi:hypothetical protein
LAALALVTIDRPGWISSVLEIAMKTLAIGAFLFALGAVVVGQYLAGPTPSGPPACIGSSGFNAAMDEAMGKCKMTAAQNRDLAQWKHDADAKLDRLRRGALTSQDLYDERCNEAWIAHGMRDVGDKIEWCEKIGVQ